jgi:Tol biopolymer transport system component
MATTKRPQALAALAILGVFVTAPAPGAQSAAAPSIDDLINLKRVATPAIAPSGQLVAYGLRETNWDENAYETEIWIGDAATGQSRQVTNARKSSSQPAFSPDGAWLGFVSDRDGKRQIYRMALRGGEAEKLTSVDEGVNNFAWSPDSKQIAFTMTDPVAEAMKEREKRWGDIRIEDQDQRYTHLHVFDIATKASKQVTAGNFVVGSFEWSPDGRNIAYDRRATSDPADGGTADISIVSIDSAPRRDRTRIRTGRLTAPRSRSSPRWRSRPTSTPTASLPRSPLDRRRHAA